MLCGSKLWDHRMVGAGWDLWSSVSPEYAGQREGWQQLAGLLPGYTLSSARFQGAPPFAKVPRDLLVQH